MTPLLSFSDVSFGYGGLDLIRSVSFDLEHGSCTALIGPNGAGKTTILRLAAGTLQSQSGNVLLNGNCVSSSMSVLPIASRDAFFSW